ncbi:MAG: hypothetical protein HY049_00520 [Acidobacteria bacterium]|nr:hypothetical protein [Acidobacteriota bacterium]
MTNRMPAIAALLCIAALTQPRGASMDMSQVQYPFGILTSDLSCPAATHLLRHPCPGFPAEAYVVFDNGREVTRYENQNVSLRGALDTTSCSLPLLHATRITNSFAFPACPIP